MSAKNTLANLMGVTKISDLLIFMQKITRRKHIRAVNYHETPQATMDNFEEQLRFYNKNYTGVSLADLQEFLFEKRWDKPKPGLIISFDDACRSNYDFALPLLEKYNFVGWFFVPVTFIDTPPQEQIDFAKNNRISYDASRVGERIAMSWSEIKQLARKHVVGCHTMNHQRLTEDLTDEQYTLEIISAKEILQQKMGKDIDTFCWVGGEEKSYSRKAAMCIREAGYKYSFMTNTHIITKSTDALQLQRSNIESNYSINMTKFQISGFMDVLYTRKRKRVNQLTKV
ncbi:polysaccharide deacetylase family protein [Candidatus Uabimicrobium amorphum]|uniref:Polysaccharide deacetylase n=1 Tax=Uabimicrobium amorphum TaxID=2596890 RepID=A0A5S9IHK2_UABAM|nr:polysaccharide deacetylase family protein [Candidatus Uabimicrobium amorphum]BBM81681.1 polysaccharide deacetylase [Candidatus Uabimicrobium amorphum]